MIPQTELKRSERVISLIASVPLMLLAIVYATIMAKLGWHHGDPDWRGILAGFPWVWFWFYGSLVLLMEKAYVDVDANGVSIYYRPLPCGMKDRRIAREEIAEITFDLIRVPKEGSYWRVGFGLVDGRKILLTERHNKEEDGRARVAAIKAVLSGGIRPELPTGSFYAPIQKKDWESVRGVILWGSAALAAIFWGLAIELSRYHR
jgi:hypothetical protein